MSASFDGINFDVSPVGMILLLSFANCCRRGKTSKAVITSFCKLSVKGIKMKLNYKKLGNKDKVSFMVL